MTLLIPDEHKEENLKLSADPYVDLFEIKLLNGTRLFFKTGDQVEWNGNTWESLPIIFNGYEVNSDEKVSRPTLQVVNPEGVFSRIVLDGDLDKAKLYRYRVLRRDIDLDRPVYQTNMWIIWMATTINTNFIIFELRNPMDGNNFITPSRQYYPPEFPTVTFR